MTLRIALIDDQTGECEIGGRLHKLIPADWAYTEEPYIYGISIAKYAIDLSGLPVVPSRSPDVASDLNYWLDEIGVPK